MDNEEDTAVSGLSLSDLLGPELLGFFDDVDLSLSGTGTGSSATPGDSYVQLLQPLQAPAPPPRDSLLNDGELRVFLELQRNKNTKKKTKSDLKTWYKWCNSIGESRAIGDIPPVELDRLLAHFFTQVRKQDGGHYEPDTLTSFHRKASQGQSWETIQRST